MRLFTWPAVIARMTEMMCPARDRGPALARVS
jgi:hypothetical protein